MAACYHKELSRETTCFSDPTHVGALVVRLGPLQDFIKQKDRSITCLPIRYSPLTNHVVDRSRLEPQHLREFLHIQKPRTVRSDIPAFVHHFNSGAHRFTSTTCLPPLFFPSAKSTLQRIASRALFKRCALRLYGRDLVPQLKGSVRARLNCSHILCYLVKDIPSDVRYPLVQEV